MLLFFLKLILTNFTFENELSFRGGFRVVPSRFEFWQGQTNRLHDRIVFRKPQDGEVIDPEFTHNGTDGWVYERLMP